MHLIAQRNDFRVLPQDAALLRLLLFLKLVNGDYQLINALAERLRAGGHDCLASMDMRP